MHRITAAPIVTSTEQVAPAAVLRERASFLLLAGAACGLAAAWVAAGSTGLLGHGLRHALTWLLLGAAAVLVWPSSAALWQRLSVIGAALGAVLITAAPVQAVNLFAAPVMLAALAAAHSGPSRRVLLLCAQATMVLALFRFAQYSSAAAWNASDIIAGAVGQVGGFITGQALNIGPTFAGLDFLVVMAVLVAALWLAPGVRWSTKAAVLAAVILAHLLYLAVLSDSERILTTAASMKREQQLAQISDIDRSQILTHHVAALSKIGDGEFDEQVRESIRKTGYLPPEIDSAARQEFLSVIGPDLDAAYRNEMSLPGRRAPYTWDAFLLAAVPWNLPALALLFQLPIAISILSIVSAKRATASDQRTILTDGASVPNGRFAALRALIASPTGVAIAALLAIGLALVTHYSAGPGDFRGKKIVAYKRGFLNWMKAEYGDMQSNMNFGRLSIGMYGMLRPFVESLGMNFRLSEELYTPEHIAADGETIPAVDDLADADVLILLYPNRRWKQSQLDRIQEFVEEGGSLLVLGEHTIVDGVSKERETERYAADEDKSRPPVPGDEWAGEEENAIRVNELLERFGIQIAFDSAEFAVGGWLQSYATVSHPTTAGIADERNTFGAVIGASINPDRLARPLVIGRYGKGDLGVETDEEGHGSYMGDSQYNAGERLGDLVLAAEKRVGRGRVIVFGDTSTLTNGVNISAHPFTGCLLAYLAAPQSTPQDALPAVVGVVLLFVLFAVTLVAPTPALIASMAGALAVTTWISVAVTLSANRVVPDGRLINSFVTDEKQKKPDLMGGTPKDIEEAAAVRDNNLAYIETSHLESFSEESLRNDGIQGLELTLMRNNYLTLMLPELTADRLLDNDPRPGREPGVKARILVSIAPQKPYTAEEEELLKQFVDRGGIWIVTAGFDESGPIRPLLADTFGFEIAAFLPNAYRPLEMQPPASTNRAYLQPPEPTPLGHFKLPFFDGGDYYCHVRFHAGWPMAVRQVSTDAAPLNVARYPDYVLDEKGEPVIASMHEMIAINYYGRGIVVGIADTGFAMNKNLERIDGSPIEGMRENAVFWRWLLSMLERRDYVWVPPKPEVVPAATAEPSANPAASTPPSENQPAAEPSKPAIDSPTNDESAGQAKEAE
jgi:hypothetical protein